MDEAHDEASRPAEEASYWQDQAEQLRVRVANLQQLLASAEKTIGYLRKKQR